MTYLQAIILAIVEGLTEFLPVSSTGHLIIASSLMGIADQPFTKTFTVSIQLGAILSVLILYYKRFLQSTQFYIKLVIGVLPAIVIGKLLNDFIDSLLGNVLVVGFSLLAGGIFLLFMDSIIKEEKSENESSTSVTNKQAFIIGLFQCIAMIPGISRSAATIVGGLTQRLTRKTAAEFSFFLAVPTMFAATAYKLFSFYKLNKANNILFSDREICLLLVGNIFAFIVAMIAIKSFITYLTKHGFKVYGYYRIFAGLIIILLLIAGVDLKVI